MNSPIKPFTDEKVEFVNTLKRVIHFFVSTKGINKTAARDEIAKRLGLKSRRQIYKWEKGRAVPTNPSGILAELNKIDGILPAAHSIALQRGPDAKLTLGSIVDLAIQYGEMKSAIERMRECKTLDEALEILQKIKSSQES